MHAPTLELDWLRAFVTVADARGFTAAGLSLGATQSAVSVRIRKLEQRLGGKLLDRNAHSVALTGLGASFLPDARRVLQMHDDVAARAQGSDRKSAYELAVSDHVAGWLLPQILAPLRNLPDGRQLSVTVGTSLELIDAFRSGRYDSIVARVDGSYAGGEVLFQDRLAWMAAKTFRWKTSEPLPLVTLHAPCGIREAALSVLASNGVPWRATFVGTGVAAVQAAVSAGFGIACLDARNCPADCVIPKGRWNLPLLPPSKIVFHAKARTQPDSVIAQTVGSAIRRSLGKPLRRSI